LGRSWEDSKTIREGGNRNVIFGQMHACNLLPSDSVRRRPDRPDWLHELKYDGHRLLLHHNGDRLRLITRGGYDLDQAVSVDRGGGAQDTAEAVRTRRRGRGARGGRHLGLPPLHSGKHDKEVQLCAFDILTEDE
jgi:hypothetical protein